MGSVCIGTAGVEAKDDGVASGIFLRQARKLVFALGRGLCSAPAAASSGAKADMRAFVRFLSHEDHPISSPTFRNALKTTWRTYL